MLEVQARAPVLRDGRTCCGWCSRSLIFEHDQEGVNRLAVAGPARHETREKLRVCAQSAMRVAPRQSGDPEPSFVRLSVSQLNELPTVRNSRIRDEDSELDGLAESIREHGLLQPLLVRPLNDVYPNGPRLHSTLHPLQPAYEVIAGNRRAESRSAGRADRG
jgi:hypothetical protein